MNVLVIVDMQHRFPAARDRELIEHVESALATVSESGTYQRAVVICYDESGMHTVRFSRASTHVIWKRGDDGGDELYAYLVGAGLIDRDLHVFIGGVNTSACVYKTACGIGNRLAEEHGMSDSVTILRDLCGDSGPYRLRFE